MKKRRNKNSEGRVAETTSVSMSRSERKWLDRRVKSLAPWVTGTSHYFQILAEIDKQFGIVGPLARNGKSRRPRP